MAVAQLDARQCEKCAVCNAAVACPIDAITHKWADDLVHNGPVVIDAKRCLGCGKCEKVCRGQAIKMV